MVECRETPGLRVVLIAVGIVLGAILVLCGVSQGVPSDVNDQLFSETGPFEEMSPWLLLILAAMIPLTFRNLSLPVLGGMVISVACAAREWDMHKSFTGYSVLKPGFYLRSEYELHHQIIAGLAVLALGASVFFTVQHMLRVRPQRLRPVPMWLLAFGLGVAMLVLTKVFDRSPKILEKDFGIDLSDRMLAFMMAIEEGLEMLMPVVFGAMVLAYSALKRSDSGDRTLSGTD
jgi:hypothetical protein